MQPVYSLCIVLACAALAIAQTPSPEVNPNYNPRYGCGRDNTNNWGNCGYPTSLLNPSLFGPHDPDCLCIYTWRGPHGYYDFWVLSDIVFGTYHDPAHWTPDPATEIVPCTTCYVNIYGRGVTFIDKFTWVNTMTVGRDYWDDAFVVVGGRNRGPATTLKVWYDRVPVIFSVEGYRQTNGQTLLKIIGKSFGFNAALVGVTVANYLPIGCYPNYQGISQYPLLPKTTNVPGIQNNIICPGLPSYLDYPTEPTDLAGDQFALACTDVRIYHRDSHIQCLASVPDLNPQELTVTVSVQFEPNRDTTPTAPVVAQRLILSQYIK